MLSIVNKYSKFLFIVNLFVVSSCSINSPNLGNQSKVNDDDWIASLPGHYISCTDFATANYITDLNKDQNRKQEVVKKIEKNISTNPSDVGYTSAYNAILSNCSAQVAKEEVGEGGLKGYASITDINSIKNNFKIFYKENSLNVSYDSNKNLEKISLTVDVSHSFTRKDNGAYPVILSNIKILDSFGNSAFFANEAVSGWKLSWVPAESGNKFLLNWLQPNSSTAINLNFDLKKYQITKSKYYLFSLVFNSYKLLIKIPNESANN